MSPFFQSSQKEARKDVTFRRLLCYISEQHLHERPPHITVDIVGSSTLANSHLFSRCPMSTPGGFCPAIVLGGKLVGVSTGANYAMSLSLRGTIFLSRLLL